MEKTPLTTEISVRDFFRYAIGGGLVSFALFVSGAFGGKKPRRPLVQVPSDELLAGLSGIKPLLGDCQHLVGMFAALGTEVQQTTDLNTAGLISEVNKHVTSRLSTLVEYRTTTGLGDLVDSYLMRAFPDPTKIAKHTIVDASTRSRLVERYNALEWLVQDHVR